MTNFERVDLSKREGFNQQEDKQPIEDKVDARRRPEELGVVVHIPIEDSKLWRKTLWRKHSRVVKNDYAKQGKKVELYVETAIEETIIGFNTLNNYLIAKHEGEEVGRTRI